MIITRMQVKGKDVLIYLSSGEGFKVPKNSVRELDIYEGLEIDEYEVSTIKNRAHQVSAIADAVRALKVRLLSRKQLIDKLKMKGHKNIFIKHAIDYCREFELVDDKRFARVLFQNLKIKGKSKYAIIRELKNAGLSSSLVEKYTAKITDNYEKKKIKEAIRKYYEVYKDKKDVNKYLSNALMRKGFNYNKISVLVKNYLDIKKKRGL